MSKPDAKCHFSSILSLIKMKDSWGVFKR